MDRATFFAIMGAFPTGVGVVTALDADGQPRGLTTNALCSVSAEPPLLLVCVDKNSNTLPALRHSQKFAGISWRPAHNGMPWLHTDSIAFAECSVEQEIEAGDHYIFVGKVEGGQPPAPGTKPLMYFRRSYGTRDGE